MRIKTSMYEKIEHVLSRHTCLKNIIDAQLDVWPEHETVLVESILGGPKKNSRITKSSPGQLLRSGKHFSSLSQICEDYRYFCREMIFQSEIYFRRYGKYERSTLKKPIETFILSRKL